jgi:hypothetical protein
MPSAYPILPKCRRCLLSHPHHFPPACRFGAISPDVIMSGEDTADATSKGAFTMRFMYLVRSATAGPPSPRLLEEMHKLAERETKAGTVVDMGGLMPISVGASVRVAGGKLDVTDGPFSESKEVVGGYAIFDFKTREDAIASAVEFMTLHQQ